jgi:hypothetical protein
VIAGAIPRIRELGLDGRCDTVSGDFFKAVPAGGDAYIMKHIIHDRCRSQPTPRIWES